MIESAGRMFEIVGREEQEFNQWEQGAKVSNPCMKVGDQVVFRSHGKVHATIAFEENGAVAADVPNFLLKEHGEIRIDLGWGLDGHIGCRTFFQVNKADKPAGYKCEDNASPDTRISFNDLKDKPFYEETEVVFDQTIEIVNTMYRTSDALPIAVGDTVNVTWDGTVYECVAIDASAMGAAGAVLVGNYPELTGVDTGEPFAIAIVPGNGTMMMGDNGSYTVKIEVGSLKTIDPKFLPGGTGFNVNVWYDDGEYVADKTYTEIRDAEATKTPIVGTLTLHDGLVFTLIGCDVSAADCVNLIAFELNHSPNLYAFHVMIFENGDVGVDGYSYTGTSIGSSFFYPR